MKTTTTLSSIAFLLAVALTGCGGGSGSPMQSETQTDDSGTQTEATYRATLTIDWTASDFPTRYPNNPHFSPLVGASHNSQVIFWEVNGQPATRGIESMAETGSTALFRSEIEAAQSNGYSQGAIQGAGVGSGQGSASVEFQASDSYPLITLVSMLAPSPDWFVGVNGYSLKSGDAWIDSIQINLPLYDAGTDTGPNYSSANADSSGDSLPITLLSSARSDTDFADGIHFDTGKYVATLTLERLLTE